MFTKIVTAAILAAAASTASAATLKSAAIAIPDDAKLFTQETKVDQNLVGGQTRGKDVFIRTGATFTGDGADLTWVNGQSYDWTLSYDGDVATMQVGSSIASYDVLNGNWNAFLLGTNAQNRSNGNASLFTSASSAVTIASVNGSALGTAITQTSNLGEYKESVFSFDGGTLSSLAGTVTFSWQDDGWNTSPGGRLNFVLKGAEVAPVPLPAGAPLLLAGIGAIVALRRRAKSRA